MYLTKFIKTSKNFLCLLSVLFLFQLKTGLAQQNLFNVPSGDITKKAQVFFQHQVNANDIFQNNSTLSVGIGHGAEMGINLYGFDLQHRASKWEIVNNLNNYEQPLNPQLLFNAQKEFEINSRFHFTFGTQTGASLTQRQKNTQFINFNYSNLIYVSKNEKIKWINGLYFGNKTYLGLGNNIGYMGGIEYSVNHRLKLSADAIVGNNASSVAVIGPCYFFTKHFALSGGWQIPFKGSNNSQACVMEFTFL